MSESDTRTMSPESAEQLQAAQDRFEQVLGRSATDADFRERLLADPREVLAEHFPEKETLPDVVFIENRGDATFVLPDPVDPEAELTEEELSTVAGGATTSPVCSVISVVAATLWLWDEAVERD